MSGSGPGFVPSGNGFIIEYAGAQGGEKRFHDITTDSSGNIYVCGETEASGNSHALVAKFNSSGVIQNQKDYDTYGGDYVFKTIKLLSSNIHLGGQRRIASVGANAFAYAKLNSSFVLQAQRELYRTSGARAASAGGAIIDNNGNYYVFGELGSDYIFSKITASHSLNYVKQYDTGSTMASPLAAPYDVNGNTVIAFYNLEYVPPNFLYKVGLARLNSSGSTDFVKDIITDSGTNVPYAVTVHSSNIYCVGQTNIQGTTDGFIVKTNSSGNVQWSRYIGGSGTDRFYSVTTDSSGNIYAAGSTNSGVSSYMLLIVKYNSSGTLQWQRTISYSGGINQYNSGITHKSGKIYVTAYRGSGSNTALVFVLPDDGSETGNFYGYGYASSSLSNGSFSPTAGTRSFTASTPSPALSVYNVGSSTERTLTFTSQVKEI